MPGTSANGSPHASVSAAIAAANAALSKVDDAGPRFPGEDAGRSLAEMANHDLDAALQLLSERAQYITGATGAAIALRRGDHHDMLCRASAGSNAPELGALLSMEYGLSGESVRTRQLLRCDDAERDSRVNHEACRSLGIASVVVMPIVKEQQVLGVFELLSDKPRAFNERDLSALARLSEMVETAVKHSAAGQNFSTVPMEPISNPRPLSDFGSPLLTPVTEPPTPTVSAAAAEPLPKLETPKLVKPELEIPNSAMAKLDAAELSTPESQPAKVEPAAPAAKKLFWSAAMRQSAAPPSAETKPIPPVLRNLQKCQACGFPVSQGRAFCVECEEKQWRGQRPPQPAIGEQKKEPIQAEPQAAAAAVGQASLPQKAPAQASPSAAPLAESPKAETPVSAAASTISDASANSSSAAPAPLIAPEVKIPEAIPTQVLASSSPSADVSNDAVSVGTPAEDSSAAFLSVTLQSESWFASNKYILGALLVVAIIIAAIALLR